MFVIEERRNGVYPLQYRRERLTGLSCTISPGRLLRGLDRPSPPPRVAAGGLPVLPRAARGRDPDLSRRHPHPPRGVRDLPEPLPVCRAAHGRRHLPGARGRAAHGAPARGRARRGGRVPRRRPGLPVNQLEFPRFGRGLDVPPAPPGARGSKAVTPSGTVHRRLGAVRREARSAVPGRPRRARGRDGPLALRRRGPVRRVGRAARRAARCGASCPSGHSARPGRT